jgi:hypothetical protein
MSLPTVPKAIFNSSLKLARAPFDLALGAFGGSDSQAKHLLDRAEAGARSATGVLFADAELREQGRAALLATKERERAAGLEEIAEQERRKAERRRREREARARKTEAKKKAKTAKTAAKVKRANAKAEKTAQLEKLEAKEGSIEAKEEAAAAEREAERLEKAAAAAKKARRADEGGAP